MPAIPLFAEETEEDTAGVDADVTAAPPAAGGETKDEGDT